MSNANFSYRSILKVITKPPSEHLFVLSIYIILRICYTKNTLFSVHIYQIIMYIQEFLLYNRVQKQHWKGGFICHTRLSILQNT